MKRVLAITAIVVLGFFGLHKVYASHPRETVRLYAGPNPRGELRWTIERIPFVSQPAWWIFEGPSNTYRALYTFTQDRLFEGNGFYGPILATFNHGTAYAGPHFFGPALFHLSGGRLFEGASTRRRILYTFRNDRVFLGGSTSGEIVLNASRDISSFTGPLELVIGLLLSEQLPKPTPTPTRPPPPTPPPPPPP